MYYLNGPSTDLSFSLFFAAEGIESSSDISFELGKPFCIDIDVGLDGIGLCNRVRGRP